MELERVEISKLELETVQFMMPELEPVLESAKLLTLELESVSSPCKRYGAEIFFWGWSYIYIDRVAIGKLNHREIKINS